MNYRIFYQVLIGILFLPYFISCHNSEEPLLSITVLSTTDIHGYVMPWDYYSDEPEPRYSLIKAASIVDSIRAADRHTLLLDAGDWLQGNPFAEYFAKTDTSGSHYPLLSVMDAMQYDAVVLGNHEFNFGLEYLNRQIEMTSTPILGGNVHLHGTDEPAYTPYIISEFEGVKVAVIGLTTPGAAVWDRFHLEGRLDFADGTETAARYVAEVKDAGADVVIVLAHSGLTGTTSYSAGGLGDENFGQSIAESVPGIDLLVLGHTHRIVEGEFVEGTDGRKIGVIQPGRWASHVGSVKLNIYRSDDGGFRVQQEKSHVIPVEHAALKQELADMINNQHEAVRSYVTATVAETEDVWDTSNARRVDTPVIDLIQHVQLRETGAQLSSSAAFTTSFEFGPGPVTRGDLANLYPYENTLFVLELTGRQVREYLEHSSGYYDGVRDGEPVTASGWPGYNFDILAGADYVMDISRPAGERITSLTYNGRDIRDDEKFTLAVNSYRAQGGGGYTMLADARIVREINTSIRSMIESYLAKTGTISHDDVFHKNWRLVY